MAKKKEESLIHLRFSANSARQGKKDILNSQIDLLNISKYIRNYKKLRKEELSKKEKIKTQIKLAKKDLLKLHKLLPALKIPKILSRKEAAIQKHIDESMPEEFSKYGTIEDQLRQIQRKLKSLEMNQ